MSQGIELRLISTAEMIGHRATIGPRCQYLHSSFRDICNQHRRDCTLVWQNYSWSLLLRQIFPALEVVQLTGGGQPGSRTVLRHNKMLKPARLLFKQPRE